MNSNIAAGFNAAGFANDAAAAGISINLDFRVVAVAAARETLRRFDFTLEGREDFAGRFFVRMVMRPLASGNVRTS
jgi:hypothetical protein